MNLTDGSQLLVLPNDDLQRAAMVGILGGDYNLQAKPDCETGNCVWPNYHALAMCSSCEDVTMGTSVSGNVWNVNVTDTLLKRHQNYSVEERLHYKNDAIYFIETYTLPHGLPQDVTIETLSVDDLEHAPEPPFIRYYASWSDKVVWPTNVRPLSDVGPGNFFQMWINETVAGINGPLLALGYLNLDAVNVSNFRRLEVVEAWECALTPCVHEYQSRMTAGKLESSIISTTYLIIEQTQDFDGTCNVTVNETTFNLGDIFAINYTAVAMLNAFEGTTSAEAFADCTENASGGLDCRYWNQYDEGNSDASATALQDSTTYATDRFGFAVRINGSHFTQLVENVATSVTSLMTYYSPNQTQGTVLVPQTYVEVRWIWIAYPLVLVVLAQALLFGVVFETSRAGIEVWKSSTMPLIYRYQGGKTPTPDSVVDGQPEGNRLRDMYRVAKQEHVRLMKADSGPLDTMWVVQNEENPETDSQNRQDRATVWVH